MRGGGRGMPHLHNLSQSKAREYNDYTPPEAIKNPNFLQGSPYTKRNPLTSPPTNQVIWDKSRVLGVKCKLKRDDGLGLKLRTQRKVTQMGS